MNTVLQGIGNEIIAGDAQPIDIMALEDDAFQAAPDIGCETIEPFVTGVLKLLNNVLPVIAAAGEPLSKAALPTTDALT